MNLTINQNIVIHQLRVNNVTNSSVLQIGSSGMIKSLSNQYNTGGFKEEGEPPVKPEEEMTPSLVPLPSPH
ncbi:spore germination protein GerPB [Paenibacillus vulneris]|uniref:Spore germination protein GerPB n=1 Tax=Paenibacillus vulneris TaxID=1133364 RepID=A0ABW3UZN3_9BACL|nr:MULTISPECIES: spore germination protein GerPB [unclassified Paenibacillus]MBE1446491.1 spore germination protein PB [Paenibacillus sp. OAS669]